MSILDDPALRLRAPHPARAIPQPKGATRLVRFRPASAYARDFAIPLEAEGQVCASYDRDGREVLNLLVEGIGYCTGVPTCEVVEQDVGGGSSPVA